MHRRRRVYLLLGLVVLSGVVLGARAATIEDAGARTLGTDEAYPGNTLISVQSYDLEGRLIEVTPDGEVVWEWAPPASRVFDAEELENGNVLVSVAEQVDAADCPDEHLAYVGDACVRNRVVELDGDTLADGDPEVVWEYAWLDEKMHNHEVHDADRLENGNTAIIDMGNNRAFIVEEDRSVVWAWNATDHIGEGTDWYERYGGPERPGGERDWTHMNDIDVLDNGDVQLSIRNFDTTLVVDRENGSIVSQVGAPGRESVMKEQHNPNRLERWGTLIIADSGNDRIVEVDTESEEIVWSYGGKGLTRYPRDADRLPNGNTLITDSFNNRVIEVNSEGEVVWIYGGVNFVYSADRLTVPEEGGETVPGWKLDGRTAETDGVVGTVRQVESWAAFVLPAWMTLLDQTLLLVGAVAGVGLVGEASATGVRRWLRNRH
jgi:hypothetical protein